MKNILLILAISLLGCSKSSEEPNNIPPELIGKWKIVETYTTDGGSPAVEFLQFMGQKN